MKRLKLDARRKTMEDSFDGINFLNSPKDEAGQNKKDAQKRMHVSSRLMISRGSTRPSAGANQISHIDVGSQP